MFGSCLAAPRLTSCGLPFARSTTVEEGGETVLPHADQKVSGEGWSECAKRGLAVKAVRGDALMFYSLKPDGSNDPASLHGSCPTLKGDKWSATKVRLCAAMCIE
jgi:prolyl 4-hydroxylase